jgi:signal transduction histidine kinase/CheY-like chemotaxis protein
MQDTSEGLSRGTPLPDWRRRLLPLVALCAVYTVAARMGLSFASIHPSASAVWPPTGIAIAAVVMLGSYVWPAILAGAFVVNLMTAGSLGTSLGIAIGNTVEALVAGYLVQRYAAGRRAFERPFTILCFAVVAAWFSTAISATIGVTVLSVAGFASWDAYGSIWLTWWLGDMSGALLVAPFIITFAESPESPLRERWAEAALVLLFLVVATMFAFGGWYAPMKNYPLAFLCVPPLVWVAIRFGPRETSAGVLVMSAIAIWGTLRGLGAFASVGLSQGLIVLQAFTGTMAIMALSMTALVTERRRIDADRLRLLAFAELARADAEAASAAKDEFLAVLSHELRNPLAAITTAIHVLQRKTWLEGDAARPAQIIERQVRQLTRLVDDLLDVTRLTTGKILLQRAPVELGALVTKSLETLVGDRTSRHKVSIAVSAVWVDGDAARLDQIATNLIANALKYTPSESSIRVAVASEDGQAVIRVADEGIGIAPDVLPHVFELFAQGEQGPDRSKGGLGIGLTLVKRLTELHGGAVEARSAGPNRGSVFTVRLTQMPAPAVEAAPTLSVAGAETSRTRQPRRVLVVEDRADARDILLVALQQAGYEVFEATDGPQAIEAAERYKPQAAIVDIGLPIFDGYEVARRLRRLPQGQEMLIVAVTGYGQPEDRKRAKAAGFDLHLVKPVEPARLEEILAGWPGTSRQVH